MYFIFKPSDLRRMSVENINHILKEGFFDEYHIRDYLRYEGIEQQYEPLQVLRIEDIPENKLDMINL